jgi:hypothetical protein
MFQLYRDGLEDLLKVKKKGEDKGSGQLKITLAEHSPTGLVQVEGANTMVAQTPADVMSIFQLGTPCDIIECNFIRRLKKNNCFNSDEC